jgi:hypothetical protein
VIAVPSGLSLTPLRIIIIIIIIIIIKTSQYHRQSHILSCWCWWASKSTHTHISLAIILLDQTPELKAQFKFRFFTATTRKFTFHVDCWAGN